MDTQQVLAELRKVGFKVGTAALNLDIPVDQVVEVVQQGGKSPSRRKPEPPPAHLAPYLVATKPSDDAWPLEMDRGIRQARYAHNAGTHTLSQRTEKGWTRLYLIPLKTPVPYRGFFPPEML
jgi:hypothetical protein